MKRYDERMLNALLDRYEHSLLSEGTNRRTVHITQKLTRTLFPEYYDEASLEYELIHEQLEELERKGLVTLSWKDGKVGHILEMCTMNPEKTGQVYALLHRRSKAEKKQVLRKVLEAYKEELPHFAGWALQRLEAGESVRQFLDAEHPKETERVLRLASAVLNNQEDRYLRSFSIDVFHDSKVAEHELSLALSIVSRFERTDLPSELTRDELLEEFRIYRNPTPVFLKGFGVSEKLTEGIGIFQDDLERYPDDLGRYSDDLKRRPENSSGDRADDRSFSGTVSGPDVVLTIENLTSYHQWRTSLHTLGSRELVIYLGGYANAAKRAFLRRLSKRYPTAAFFHFGDIDAGGFRIWKNLSQETGIPIRTWRMDTATFETYLSMGRPLTQNDRKALEKMKEDPFFTEQRELFERMLKENTKIEQECIVQ